MPIKYQRNTTIQLHIATYSRKSCPCRAMPFRNQSPNFSSLSKCAYTVPPSRSIQIVRLTTV